MKVDWVCVIDAQPKDMECVWAWKRGEMFAERAVFRMIRPDMPPSSAFWAENGHDLWGITHWAHRNEPLPDPPEVGDHV